MNKKTALLFQDNGGGYFFNIESRLTALLFNKNMADKAQSIIYEENEDYESVNNFKTIAEIQEILNKNGIEYEEIDISFFDYNNPEEESEQ